VAKVQELRRQELGMGWAVEPGGQVEQNQAGQTQGERRGDPPGDASLGDQQGGGAQDQHPQRRKMSGAMPLGRPGFEKGGGHHPQNHGLQREAPEHAAPHVEMDEDSPEQRPEEGTRGPDHRLDPEQAAPQMLGERLLDGDVAQGDQHAAADALHEARGEQRRHVGRQRGRDAAGGVEQCRCRQDTLDAATTAEQRRRGASHDRPDLVERDGPGNVGHAANVGDNCRHGGRRDQRVGGVQPDAHAQQDVAPELPRAPNLPPSACIDLCRHATTSLPPAVASLQPQPRLR
jgi:hypothetical protein